MEHLITFLIKSSGDLDKRFWTFGSPNNEEKSFAQLEDEGWELTAVFKDWWIWKRQRLG